MNISKNINRLSLMFIRTIIVNNINTSLPISAQKYLRAIEKKHKYTNKSSMREFTMTQYDDTREIQDHILNITDKVIKLKVLDINMNNFFLIQFIINSLLSLV